jgi:eukaryotic-like serine/threonine-protein kinase
VNAERLGKYELVRHLASGGMASVYLARLSGLGGFQRHVVLKTLRGGDLEDDPLVPMFLDEARLIATLHHQHIAQVYEVGLEDDTYFLAMEYVHGETVRAVLETANKHGYILPLEFGLTVACAAAAGLHHAHERRNVDGAPLGIVHRDVTPSNVIVSYDGSIKLIDFGIAKANDRSTKTRSGMIKGKAGYMAPEQVKGQPVDRRSDVFALGVLAYELTTQCRAFQAASQFEQLERIAHGEIFRPSKIVKRYPPELEHVVMQALELDPDDRYPDAETARKELDRVAHELGLNLGAPSVIKVLDDLYGPRPEPWLVAPGQIDYDITPSIPDLPFSLEVLDESTKVPRAEKIAKGTGEIEIVPEREQPARPDESVVVRPPTYNTAMLPVRTKPRPHLVFGVFGALAAVTLAAGAVITLVVATDDTHELVLPDPPAPPPAAPKQRPPAVKLPARVVAPPPKPIAKRDRVMLDVVTDPPGASVVLDGVKLGTAPFHAEVPAKSTAWLKVRRFDRVPVRIKVELDRDVTWNVKLPARTR